MKFLLREELLEDIFKTGRKSISITRCLKIIILLFSINLSTYSQEHKSTKIKIFNDKLEKIYYGNTDTPDSSIAIFKKMLLDAQKKKDVIEEFYLLINIGEVYTYQKINMGLAMYYFKTAHLKARNAHLCEQEILSLIFENTVVFALKNYTQFIKNYEYIETLCKRCPSSKNILYVYTQLGLNYNKIRHNKAKANYYFMKADSVIKVRGESISSKTISFAYSEIINFYKDVAPQKIPYFINAAKKVSLNALKDNPSRGFLHNVNLSNLYEKANQIDSAIMYGERAINTPLSQLEPENKDYFFEEISFLSKLYEQKKDYKKALIFQKKYSTIKDSLALVDKKNAGIDKINLLTQQHNLEKKQQELSFNKILIILISLIVLISIAAIIIIQKNSRKIKRLYERVNRQNKELSHLNIVRSKMFSILSHDLISPIGALKNTIEMYQRGLFEKEEFDQNINNIKGSLSSILSTIKSIVGWSHSISNKETNQITFFSFYQLIQELFELQMTNAQLKNLELINNVREDFLIKANFNHISLIARNLIDNSVKYLPKDGKLTVTTEQINDEITLIFHDNGLGIQSDIINNIFSQSVKKVDTPTIHLGFQMIYDIIKINNYKITIDSQPNMGSIFKIYLPNH